MVYLAYGATEIYGNFSGGSMISQTGVQIPDFGTKSYCWAEFLPETACK